MSIYVGEQALSDGSSATERGDSFGNVVTHEIYGKHFSNTLKGRTFLYTVASQALLLSATTGGHPTVFNPAGSGFVFVPTELIIGFISGTTVIGSVNIATTLAAGSAAATGAAILTATAVTPKNAFRQCSTVFNSAMVWSPTTNTFTAAPTVDYATGMNLGAAAPTGSGDYRHKFDGTLAYYPGSAMSVVYSVTTSTALFTITIVGMELPLPAGR